MPFNEYFLLILLFSIFFWCHSRKLFEEAGEVLGILEAEAVGNLRDTLRGVEEQLLAKRENVLLNIVLCRHARLLTDEVAKVAR